MDLSYLPVWMQAVLAIGITFVILGLFVVGTILWDRYFASPGI